MNQNGSKWKKVKTVQDPIDSHNPYLSQCIVSVLVGSRLDLAIWQSRTFRERLEVDNLGMWKDIEAVLLVELGNKNTTRYTTTGRRISTP